MAFIWGAKNGKVEIWKAVTTPSVVDRYGVWSVSGQSGHSLGMASFKASPSVTSKIQDFLASWPVETPLRRPSSLRCWSFSNLPRNGLFRSRAGAREEIIIPAATWPQHLF